MDKDNGERLFRSTETSDKFDIEIKGSKFRSNFIIRNVGWNAPQDDLEGAFFGEVESVKFGIGGQEGFLH